MIRPTRSASNIHMHLCQIEQGVGTRAVFCLPTALSVASRVLDTTLGHFQFNVLMLSTLQEGRQGGHFISISKWNLQSCLEETAHGHSGGGVSKSRTPRCNGPRVSQITSCLAHAKGVNWETFYPGVSAQTYEVHPQILSSNGLPNMLSNPTASRFRMTDRSSTRAAGFTSRSQVPRTAHRALSESLSVQSHIW